MDNQFIVLRFDGNGLPLQVTVWAERTPEAPQQLAQWTPEPFDRPEELLAAALAALTVQGTLL